MSQMFQIFKIEFDVEGSLGTPLAKLTAAERKALGV